ncbi:MAG: hypothetical protein NTV12_11000 [Verrucomicrobia bacterium]|nr:hypothetical protein [Verrucomicrobiota bacterium]
MRYIFNYFRWIRCGLLIYTIASALVVLSRAAPTQEAKVSFTKELIPLFRRSCMGCHQPAKAKGGLDLTTYTALLKGGKHAPAVVPKDAKVSRLIKEISGEEPAMPEEGEPLTTAEVGLVSRWITEGAIDDTPPGGFVHRLAAPPVYPALPAISALAWSPQGTVLAVAGWHEVILYSGASNTILARLVGDSPRIESIAFSPDGTRLAVAGGAPSEYGEVQIWDTTNYKRLQSIKTTADVVFGVSWSPNSQRVAIGCADKMARVFSVADGVEIMKCDNHIDWVFATAWSQDGARLVTASRDRALKLIDVASGHLVDDVNRQGDPLISLARHPTENLVVCGNTTGSPRVYRMEPRGGRLAEGDDKENSFVRELQRLPGTLQTLAWSGDGRWIAAGSSGAAVWVFNAADGGRKVSLKWTGGPVFAVAFQPSGEVLAVGGSDGKIRFFDFAKDKLLREMDGVPLTGAAVSPTR